MTTGRDVSHMFIAGFRLRPTPSTTTMVRCSRISSVRVSIPKRSVTSNRCASSRAIEIRVASWPKIGSPTERSAWAKASVSRSRGTYPASKCTSATRR